MKLHRNIRRLFELIGSLIGASDATRKHRNLGYDLITSNGWQMSLGSKPFARCNVILEHGNR